MPAEQRASSELAPPTGEGSLSPSLLRSVAGGLVVVQPRMGGAQNFQAVAAKINVRAAAFAAAAVRAGCEPLQCELRHTHRSGYALHCTHDVAAGDALLRVPRSAWQPFSCDWALAEAERSPARQHLLRCAQAVEQQLGRQGVAGSANFSRAVLFTVQLLQPAAELTPEERAYIDFLPNRDELDVPLLWDEDRLALLEGSPALEQIKQRRRFTRAVHEALFGEDGGSVVGMELTAAQPFESTIPLTPVFEAEYGWASSVLLSRATSSGAGRAAAAAAGGSTAPPFTLVPMMDCVNHSLDPNSEYFYDPVAGDFTVTSTRAISRGDEITISYGPLSNARLMRLYGFALPCNPHDTVALYTPHSPVLKGRSSQRDGAAPSTFSLFTEGEGEPKHAVQWTARAAELLPRISELTASSASLPPRLLGARALLLEGSAGKRVEQLIAAMGGADMASGGDEVLLSWLGQFDQLAASGQMPPDVLRPVVQAVLTDCLAALERYPTTLEQDDVALHGAEQAAAADLMLPGRQPGGGLGGLRMLAGEKAILARTARALHGLLQSLGG